LLSHNNTTNYTHNIRTRHDSGVSTGNAIDFYVWDANIDLNTDIGSKLALTLLGNGNVGLGSTTPGTALSIGDTGANTINISAVSTSTFGSGINIATGCFAINGTCLSTGGGSGTVSAGTAGQFPYYAANGTTLTATSSVFLATSGNVGIGTTSPYSKMTLWGTDSLLEAVNTASSTIFSIGQNGATSTNFSVSGVASSTNLVTSNSFRLANLTGFLKATAGVVATSLVDLANDVTGILGVTNGGTGWSTGFTSNALLLGNGTNRISTTTAGTNGQVLALVSGIPTWVATTTAGTGLSYNGTSFNVNASQNITTLSNLTTDGVVYTSGGNGTLNVDASGLDVARGGTGQTSFTSSQLVYGNGTNALTSVATTSFTPSAEFTVGGTLGALVGGANSTLTLATNGVALTKLAQVAANTILGNATGAVGNITAFATSTLGINFADLIGSATDAQVANNLTISGGTIDNTPIGATSAATGVFTNSTSTNATSTTLFATTASSTNLSTSNFRLANLSGFLKATAGVVATALIDLANDVSGILPVANGGTGWANLQANTLLIGNGTNRISTTTAGTNGQVLALVSGIPTWVATTTAGTGLSYNGTSFNVNASQNITTLSNLTGNGLVYTSGGTGTLNTANFSANTIPYVNGAGTAILYTATSTLNLGVSGGGTNATSQTTNGVNYFDGTRITSGTGLTFTGTNFGIGTTTPWGMLSVNPNALGANVPAFVVGSSTATRFIITNGGNVGIGTSTPGSLLTLSGSTAEIQALSTSLNRSARFGVLDGANTIVDNLGGGWTILKASGTAGLSTSGGGVSIGSYAGVTAAPANGMIVSGSVGIGTTTPQWILNPFSATAPQLSLSSGADSSQWTMRAINGNLYFATTTVAGTATSTTAQLTINSSGTVIIGDGTGKLTLGTFDPVYTVNGVAYATYAAGMVGIKEEVTGNADVTTQMTAPDGSTGYVHTIDFDTEAVGGDLWLFAQTTQLRKNIDKLVVLLSAEGNTKVWYQVDRASRKVHFLSNTPTRVSYRMTAPRFDHESWTNLNHDGVAGFLPPSNDVGDFHTSTSTISFGNTQLLVGTTTIAELIATEGSVTPVKPWTSAMTGVSAGLKNAMNGIGAAVVQAYEGAQYFADGIFKRIFAGEIHTDQLCVSDENGETCITKAQLDALIAGAGNSGGGSGGNGGGGNPDTEAPVITIVGNNPAHIYVGDTYADLGATVTDNVDQNLGIVIFVDDVEVSQVTIDTAVAGEHTVRYESTDTAGNVGSATRTVVVDEPVP
jgi:hypothetical protein